MQLHGPVYSWTCIHNVVDKRTLSDDHFDVVFHRTCPIPIAAHIFRPRTLPSPDPLQSGDSTEDHEDPSQDHERTSPANSADSSLSPRGGGGAAASASTMGLFGKTADGRQLSPAELAVNGSPWEERTAPGAGPGGTATSPGGGGPRPVSREVSSDRLRPGSPPDGRQESLGKGSSRSGSGGGSSSGRGGRGQGGVLKHPDDKHLDVAYFGRHPAWPGDLAGPGHRPGSPKGGGGIPPPDSKDGQLLPEGMTLTGPSSIFDLPTRNPGLMEALQAEDVDFCLLVEMALRLLAGTTKKLTKPLLEEFGEHLLRILLFPLQVFGVDFPKITIFALKAVETLPSHYLEPIAGEFLSKLICGGVLPRSDFQGMEELMLSGLAIFEVLDEDEVRSAKMCKVGID